MAGDQELQRLQEEYERLKRSLLSIGYVCPGSIAKRFIRCGKYYCLCGASWGYPHGPYYEWSTKRAGRTIHKRLSLSQAAAIQRHILDDRRLRDIVAAMRRVSERIVFARVLGGE